MRLAIFRRTPPAYRLRRRQHRLFLPALVLVLGLGAPACRPTTPPSGKATREQASAVLEHHRDRMIATFGAVGVGLGRSGPGDENFVLVIYLAAEAAVPAPPPASFEGVPLVFKRTGVISLPEPSEQKEQDRPGV